MADGKPDINDPNDRPLYWKNDRGSVSVPTRAMNSGFDWVSAGLTTADNDAERIVNAANGEKYGEKLLKKQGQLADIPQSTSCGVGFTALNLTRQPHRLS